MKFQGLKKESVSSNGLLNQPNSVGILTFPANKVVTSIPDGVIKAGMYGTDAYDVELLEDTTVRGGLFTAPVKLKAKFKWSQANLDKEIQKGTTIKIPTLKLSPSYEKLEYDPEVPPNLINYKVGVETNEQAGNHQLQFFDKKVFNFPKPVSLIQYLCEFIDTKNKDCIVMDFFSGSGTTAEAVMRMNMKPRKNKVKYILVQLPEDVTETIKKAKTPSEKEIMQNHSIAAHTGADDDVCLCSRSGRFYRCEDALGGRCTGESRKRRGSQWERRQTESRRNTDGSGDGGDSRPENRRTALEPGISGNVCIRLVLHDVCRGHGKWNSAGRRKRSAESCCDERTGISLFRQSFRL